MLFERDENLRELNDLVLHTCDKGQGSTVLISGEAGIGKTSLLNAFQNQLVQNLGTMVEVAWGGCDPLYTPRALGPLHDMAFTFSDGVKNLLQNDSDASQLFDALLDFFKNRSKTYILIFEDVHWADHATLDLLKFLSRRVSFLNVILVISFRDDEIGQGHPLNDVIAAIPSNNTHRLKLQPLSVAGIKQLVASFNSQKIEAEIHSITGGNPFFATELLASSSSSSGHVPASILDAVSARINRLNKEEQEFLEIFSLIPKAVNIDLLKILFSKNAETYAMACVGRGMLTMVGSDAFRFRHELARLGTLERVSVFERKRLHADILDALLELNIDYELEHLVHHAVGALNAEKVLEYAPKAAALASSSGSHREAAAHLSTAIRFIDSASTEQAAQLYESWALETGLTLGIDDEVIDARRHAISLWRALGRKEKVGENLRWLSRLFWYRGEAAEAWRYADESVRVLEDTPPSAERAMAYSLRSQFHMLNDNMDESIVWGEKALELETKFNNARVRAHALNNIGTAKALRGNEEGVDDLRESLKISLENNLHVDAARVYTNLSEYAVKYKNFSLAEKIFSEGIAFDTKHDLDSWTYYLIGRFAELRLLQGRLTEAKTIVEGVIKLDHLTLLMKLPAQLVLSRILSLTCDSEALNNLQKTLSSARSTGEIQHIIPARLQIIEYAWLRNDNQLLMEQLNQLYRFELQKLDLWTVGEVALWSKRIGYKNNNFDDHAYPEPITLELAGNITVASEKWLQIGMPIRAAMSLLNIEESSQVTELNQAMQLIDPIGALAIRKKIKMQAEFFGVTEYLEKMKRGPYKASKKHPLGLTGKEQEVFKLLIEGGSNRVIAEQLNRSQRTIEHHVSSILKKMNADSRMDAMLRVQNEPWLMPQN